MIIDSHEHLMFPTEVQIKKMDEAGVDKTILFGTAPHPERAVTFSDLKNEMGALYKILAGSTTREANIQRMKDNISEVVQVIHEYPDRFYGFGSVPLELSLEDTVDWIKKQIVSNGLKGVGEFTPGSDEQIKQLETIFKALESFPYLPIWVHTLLIYQQLFLRLLLGWRLQSCPKNVCIVQTLHMENLCWVNSL
ncbi:hypothetical protein MKA58_12265 [[Clostridium] innocuum]|nr:hypothetical protein [[Clostridium] innocuum]